MRSALSLVFTVTALLFGARGLPTANGDCDSLPPLQTLIFALPNPVSQGPTLKYIALGLGTQNYTCPNQTTTPISVGARATLSDATAFLSSSACLNSVSTLPAHALGQGNSLGLPILGEHYFTASETPSFDLYTRGLFLSARKVDDVPAPANSWAGAEGEGAVDWLYLVDDDTCLSKGLTAVYRIETAGGKPPATCEGLSGPIEVDYAAEYWFYDCSGAT